MNAEREHDKLIRSWKTELTTKQREFEKLQQSLQPPRDLQLLRIQIQEELEVPYGQRIAELESMVCTHMLLSVGVWSLLPTLPGYSAKAVLVYALQGLALRRANHSEEIVPADSRELRCIRATLAAALVIFALAIITVE